MSKFASPTFGVQEALGTMSFSNDLKAFILGRREEWADFGKMNSHMYREKLMKLMIQASLSAEARFMVFFFFSVIKNQPRVVRAMENMDATAKAQQWYAPTLKFINSNVTQYVTATKGNTKMPAVNIPTCNPGLDILVYCLITSPENLTINNMRMRTTFSQLNLDKPLQDMAKEGYAHYWDQVVKGTKNTVSTESPKMREEYYQTSASDTYNLIDLDLKEIKPKDPKVGYTEAELKDYIEILSKVDNNVRVEDGKKK